MKAYIFQMILKQLFVCFFLEVHQPKMFREAQLGLANTLLAEGVSEYSWESSIFLID